MPRYVSLGDAAALLAKVQRVLVIGCSGGGTRLESAGAGGESEPEAVADWPLPKQVISFPQGEPVAVMLRNS
jgi:hypothetical protein